MLHSARQHAPVPGLAPGGCSAWASRQLSANVAHGLGIAATLSANVAHGLGHAPGWRCCGRMACGSAGWVVRVLMTIIRGARVPQDLPGPAGVSAGAPEADPLRVRAAEVFADERILHRHARRHRTVHPGEWADIARGGA